MTADQMATMLSQFTFATSSEDILHGAVQEFFRSHEIQAQPEHALSARDRIDFYVTEGKIGVECKIDGSANEVTRQLLRYAESANIDGLILVTSRNKHRKIPPTLGGKPVRIVLTRAF